MKSSNSFKKIQRRETRAKYQKTVRNDNRWNTFGGVIRVFEQLMCFIIDPFIAYTSFAFAIFFVNAMLNGVETDRSKAILSLGQFLFLMFVRAMYYEDFENNNEKPMDKDLIAYAKWALNFIVSNFSKLSSFLNNSKSNKNSKK